MIAKTGTRDARPGHPELIPLATLYNLGKGLTFFGEVNPFNNVPRGHAASSGLQLRVNAGESLPSCGDPTCRTNLVANLRSLAG